MSGIEISEEVTAAQLEALSGGELLRAEVIKQINLRLLKLIDSNWFQQNTNKNNKFYWKLENN